MLFRSAEEIADGETLLKCAPPIRGRSEREALCRALAAGELTLVASDHSPASRELKLAGRGDFSAAWGGIASLQLTLPAVWTAMSPHVGDLAGFVCRALSEEPARLAGLFGPEGGKGAIAPGFAADLVAFDPAAHWTVDQELLLHRHKLTPYHGRELVGRVMATWLRGRKVFDCVEINTPRMGRWLRRNAPPVDPASALA